MRVAVVGSRRCPGLTVGDIVRYLPASCTEIVSGGAVGVDRLAREAAAWLGIPITEFLPQYALFGKRAPLVRNQQIIDYADSVLAFWDYCSRGTRHAIQCARKSGKDVRIVPLPAQELS